MKKLKLLSASLLLCISALISLAAYAAYDFQPARAIPLGAAATIDANTTNTTAVTLYGLKGNAELLVYASGATNRTELSVALWCTNDVTGWQPYAVGSFAATNAGVYRVTFAGEYVSRDCRVEIGSLGAASTCWGLILAY